MRPALGQPTSPIMTSLPAKRATIWRRMDSTCAAALAAEIGKSSQ
jgi:hypothetical protein